MSFLGICALGVEPENVAEAIGIEANTLRDQLRHKPLSASTSAALQALLREMNLLVERTRPDDQTDGLTPFVGYNDVLYAKNVAESFAEPPNNTPRSWNFHIVVSRIELLEVSHEVVCDGLLRGLHHGKHFWYFTPRPQFSLSGAFRSSENSSIQSFAHWEAAATDQLSKIQTQLLELAKNHAGALSSGDDRVGEPRSLRDLLRERVRFCSLPEPLCLPHKKLIIQLSAQNPGIEALVGRDFRIVRAFTDTVLPEPGTKTNSPYDPACKWFRQSEPLNSDVIAGLLLQFQSTPLEWGY